jgi:hypothetical protein
MTQSFEAGLQMLKERQKEHLKSKEIKKLIREVNQETEGIKRQGTYFFTGLLCGNGEGEDHDTI